MNVLQVKISGRLAHFRKVYSNSTSLSYYFPPRTTIIGILASALGRERNSYYEEFSPERLSVAVEALTPLKKLIFSESYLKIKKVNYIMLRGLNGRVPTAREFIAPNDGDHLTYAFYFYPARPELMEAFKRPFFPLSLGPSNLLAWVDDVRELECMEVRKMDGMEIYGAAPADLFIGESQGAEVVVEDAVPRAFIGGRRTGKLSSYFFSVNARPYLIRSGSASGIECKGRALAFL
ncbi:MAG: CRISPR-associated protein Cas5 [Nitrososphaeria archaeon]